MPCLLWPKLQILEGVGLGFLADAARRDMLELISSLPALYTLHFLDEPTFAAAPPTLGADPGGFSLASYPSIDVTVPSLRADAYHPQTSGGLVRYPVNTGFDLSELGYAATQFQQLAAPMLAAMSQQFYNIRGVSTKWDGTVRDNTVGAVKWAWISPVFNPTDPSPIADDGMVPGDGTQPAWSARLATNAAARCIDVKDVLIEHTCMMNHPKVIL